MADERIDNFKTSITKGVAALNVKTSVFLETAKIKTQINTLENEIKNLKSEIGDKTFWDWKNQIFDLANIQDALQLILQKVEKIEILRQAIIKLENQQKEVFGEKTSNTGNTMLSVNNEENRFVCSKCQSLYSSPTKFCRKCGNRMTD